MGAKIFRQGAGRVLGADMQKDAIRRGPAPGRFRQGLGVAIGATHIRETGLDGFLRGLRSHRENRQIAARRAADESPDAIGAAGQQSLHIVQRAALLFQQRAVLKARLQQRRQQGLMAALGQQRGDFLAVFQRSGHENMHDLMTLRDTRLGVKHRPMTGKSLTILGIETSCDETAAAVVRGRIPGPGEILSNIVFSQTEAHAPYGGVVPEIASRAHLEILDDIIERALDEARITLAELDGVAATAGPGLIGGVMVGLTTAKALALGAGKPLIAVNHLMGHALTARLTHGVEYPFLLLLVSGGHCQLVGVGGPEDFRLYGSTIDDAVGEAFDKTAKILGLPYPGGPAVETAARTGDAKAYDLPRPLLNRRTEREGADFSFSGLKTAVRQLAQKDVRIEDASASFQAAVIDILCDRSRIAMDMFRRDFPAGDTFVVAGGVAANQAIGEALTQLCRSQSFVIRVPPPRLCTDNAAMIAWAGVERLSHHAGGDALSTSPRARWPLAERR